jgi:hypothetical protein
VVSAPVNSGLERFDKGKIHLTLNIIIHPGGVIFNGDRLLLTSKGKEVDTGERLRT